MSSSDSDSDFADFDIPEELLKREEALKQRNAAIEDQIKGLLRSTSLEEPLPLPDKFTLKLPEQENADDTLNNFLKEQEKPKRKNFDLKSKNIPKSSNASSNNLLPQPKKMPQQELFEVEIPQNVEAVPEVKYDPVPDLRNTMHKLIEEIEKVSREISSVQKDKNKTEIAISKQQSELKRVQNENQRVTADIELMTAQITEGKEHLTQIANEVEASRISRIEKLRQQQEANKNKSAIEAKIKKQRAEADRLQQQYQQMPAADGRAQKMNSEKLNAKSLLDRSKKSLRQAKLLLEDIEKACNHEEKIYEHILSAKSVPISPEYLKRGINELLN
ncbi:hypothetical protein TVAG_029200 [Trichomonas vaginalis G3]|uniref:Uncharacterized protein n=1 Tax=Trichomonas vaginalis (strain ATCC PRA-98 / G3) TaxID=412133 RepID=A2F512_TRIV3|nr:hypothetical protein TVAGG3_0594670 [Trichomonas vaginalis G3]EAY00016.1 hypothetical protein TVAG_029200 [Trichomonas vaginalis G3]KAI5523517.1 hypothetical protein TVAGG3_0594670 [Trichomonas vaginalis G3]|eukprot:XP_001312945.1 hypothetical protein [Trichomonas vaginalis G3]